jgi:hypothetical protein
MEGDKAMDTRPTNDRKNLNSALRPEADWAALTPADRVRYLELEGYVVLPDLLSSDQIGQIREEMERLPMTGVDYSEHQRGSGPVQWTDSPCSISVIAQPEMIKFLEALFGDDVVFCTQQYSLSQPGHPGIAIHTDAQPYGSKIFGLGASSPCLVRALYYLDDLTPDCSPFKVIPRSHLSLHADGNPYHRYLRHPEEVMVTCKAGSAVIINQKVFHGNFPNYSDRDRRMLAIAYRPAWAGPLAEVEEHDMEQVKRLPAAVGRLFKSPNVRSIEFDVPNRPPDLAIEAPGINPSRWGMG